MRFNHTNKHFKPPNYTSEMSFTITFDFILELLLTGLAISIAAFLMPFVHVRSFGYAVLVGLLITVVNYAIWWLLGAVGIDISVGSSLGRALINFFIYVAAIMGVDALLKGFRVSGFIMAALFAIIVAVVQYFLAILIAAII